MEKKCGEVSFSASINLFIFYLVIYFVFMKTLRTLRSTQTKQDNLLTIHNDSSFCHLFSTCTGIISSVIQTDIHNLQVHLQLLLPHLAFVSIFQQLCSFPPLHRRGRFVELTAQNYTVTLRHLLADKQQLKTWW